MKKKNRNSGTFKYACCILVIIELFITIALFSQKVHSNAAPYWNNELSKIAFVPQVAGWYQFRPGIIKNAKQFFINYKSVMGLKDDDEMKLIRTDADGDLQHHKFQQYYKGIKIEGAEFIIHEKNGYASSGNGKLVHDMNKVVISKIDEGKALFEALKIVSFPFYKSNNNNNSVLAKDQYHPKGELVFQKANIDSLFLSDNFKLCYKFDIVISISQAYSVYINAVNGELVNKISLVPNDNYCNSTTINAAHNYGNRTINTYYASIPSLYYLFDSCNYTTTINVYNDNNDTLAHTTPYTNTSNTNWSSTVDMQSAVTSLWCCRRSMDFYKSVFSRMSYDNNNSRVTVYQNAGFADGTGNVGYQNASFYYPNGSMAVGNGEGSSNSSSYDDFNTIDIIGHELSHGVTGTSSNLNYQGESGALNESFSDILGTYIEYWDGSTPFDWYIGEDRGTPIRNMSNPNDYNQPDTYHGSYWYFGTQDAGGVHTNSGVQNYWFYLLSAGGRGVNDNNTSFNVVGVSVPVAGFIAYKTDTYYLTSSSDYADARIGSTQAAIDYYGLCSNVSQQVANAWDAVGVSFNGTIYYPSSSPTIGCGTYSATNSFYNFSSTSTLSVAQTCAVTFNPSNLPYGYSLTAANSVVLYPGFSSLEGSNTDIFIQSCDLESRPAFQSNRQIAESSIQDNELQSTDKISGLNAYPNPTTSIIHLDFTADINESNAVIQVFNMQMQKVQELRLGDLIKGRQNKTVDISKQASGVYYIIIQLSNKKLTAKVSVLR